MVLSGHDYDGGLFRAGKELTDQLSLASHGYLSGSVTFVDARETIIQADTDRNQGANISVIRPILVDRGFLRNAAPDVPSPPVVVPGDEQLLAVLDGTQAEWFSDYRL